MDTWTIAIIGGGPAGARTAEMLARGGAGGGSAESLGLGLCGSWLGISEKPQSHKSGDSALPAALGRLGNAPGGRADRSVGGLRPAGGRRVIVFEGKIGWEKPCGGGLTHKALRRYPFLAQAPEGGKLVSDAEFIAPSGAAMHFHLRSPLAVYSRATLSRLLLKRAEEAGAEIVADKILRLRRTDSGWELEGRRKAYRADFVVLAGGAHTPLRQTLVEALTPRDFMLTFGYYLSVPCELACVQFYENFAGYAWTFPRPDHVSIGICGKVGAEPTARLHARLSTFMQRSGYAPDPARIFSHLLPSLSVESWGNLRLVGKGWALVGDAAGLVDPITGEGIYYAMRSGDLLAEALLEGVPELYPERLWSDFGRGLAVGARLASIFYRGEFLGGSIPTRMIEFGTRSRRFLEVIQDLLEGSKSYPRLMARVQLSLARTLLETGAGLLREKFAPPRATQS